MVACLSEHGFVGSLNDALLAKVVAVMAESPCQLRVLGRLGGCGGAERGLNVQESDSMPTTLGAVARTASALLFEEACLSGSSAVRWRR